MHRQYMMDQHNKSIPNLRSTEVLQECVYVAGRTLNEADHHQRQSASQAQGCNNSLINHLDQLKLVKIQLRMIIIIYRVNSRKLQVQMASRMHLNDLWHLIVRNMQKWLIIYTACCPN